MGAPKFSSSAIGMNNSQVVGLSIQTSEKQEKYTRNESEQQENKIFNDSSSSLQESVSGAI
jgi:hypothetical protein